MGLRIRTNIPSLEVQKNLRKSTAETESEFAKLSSGKRINKAADDAAGMAIANRLDAHVRGLRQATRNANDGISMVQTAEGGVGEVSNILIRLRELAVQAASDTVGEKERTLLNREYQSMLSEVDRISDSVAFNGTKLLAGSNDRGLIDIHVGADAGEEHKITFDSEEANIKTDVIGIAGSAIDDKEGAIETFTTIDEAIDHVVDVRAKLGSMQSRLQSTVANLETQTINEDSARSVIEDVDVAESTANLASKSIVKAGGISMLTQANGLPNNALRLIG